MKSKSTSLLALSAVLILAACGSANPQATTTAPRQAPVERGSIAGWQNGNAVVYATVGFFTPNPQIVAVGAVRVDGSFSIDYPAELPPDVLATPGLQCATIRASNPMALTAFTGNDIVFQHGKPIGSLHSGSSPGVASFTSVAPGDTRTGYVYASADTTQTGECSRTITFGTSAVEFTQNFDLNLHRGWNQVFADFSTPRPGVVVSDLKNGANPAESFYFFKSPNQ